MKRAFLRRRTTGQCLPGMKVPMMMLSGTSRASAPWEQARAAAHLVRVQYAPAKGRYDLESIKDSAKPADSFGNDDVAHRNRRRLSGDVNTRR